MKIVCCTYREWVFNIYNNLKNHFPKYSFEIISKKEYSEEIIKRINPDIIVKGGDYKSDDVVGNDIAKVKIFNYIDGYSTTKILETI